MCTARGLRGMEMELKIDTRIQVGDGVSWLVGLMRFGSGDLYNYNLTMSGPYLRVGDEEARYTKLSKDV